MTLVDQAADDGYILDVHRPDDVALVHGVDVVDLHADVAHGVLAREGMRLDALQRSHGAFGSGAHREVHLARREPAQQVDTRLQVLLLGLQHEVVVRGQRRGVERRDEDRLRRVVGRGDDAVGALNNHRPETRMQQQLDDLLARRLLKIGLRELLVALHGVGRDRHGENPAFLAAVYGRHLAADGRREENALVVLVEEQRRTGLHLITHLNQQLGSHALEIEG